MATSTLVAPEQRRRGTLKVDTAVPKSVAAWPKVLCHSDDPGDANNTGVCSAHQYISMPRQRGTRYMPCISAPSAPRTPPGARGRQWPAPSCPRSRCTVPHPTHLSEAVASHDVVEAHTRRDMAVYTRPERRACQARKNPSAELARHMTPLDRPPGFPTAELATRHPQPGCHTLFPSTSKQ